MRTYEQNLGYFEVADTAPPVHETRRGWLARGLDAIALWRERARSRRHLQALNDFMLRDIGIDRGTAECEAGKRFWQG